MVSTRGALGLLIALGIAAPAQTPKDAAMRWSQLPPIPDAEGFAAAFAGVSGGALLVAGGANIPADKWADAFVKKWYDSVFVLERPDGAWQRVSELPRPGGYGVSATIGDAVVCAGGSDATQHFRAVFALRWKGGAIATTPLPDLPRPCANACGAAIGQTLYIAGGIETPTANAALKTFWALDLADSAPRWRELEPCPGPARMLAVAGASHGSFFLFTGTALSPDAGGKPVREYLRDAWRYTPGRGWTRLADLPRAAVAAPSPAMNFRDASLLVVTGDDGANVTFKPIEQHPGFPRNALAYDTRADRWTMAGDVPLSRATAPTTVWHARYVIPNGEVRPRVRTPEVWALEEAGRPRPESPRGEGAPAPR
jgi:N-acetylneuraminic acid mutarotase